MCVPSVQGGKAGRAVGDVYRPHDGVRQVRSRDSLSFGPPTPSCAGRSTKLRHSSRKKVPARSHIEWPGPHRSHAIDACPGIDGVRAMWPGQASEQLRLRVRIDSPVAGSNRMNRRDVQMNFPGIDAVQLRIAGRG